MWGWGSRARSRVAAYTYGMAVFGRCIAAVVVGRRRKWSRRRWQARGRAASRSRPPSRSLSFSYRRWNVVFLFVSFHQSGSSGRHSRWSREGSSPVSPALITASAQPGLSRLPSDRSSSSCVFLTELALRNGNLCCSIGVPHVRFDDGIVLGRVYGLVHPSWLVSSVVIITKLRSFSAARARAWRSSRRIGIFQAGTEKLDSRFENRRELVSGAILNLC